MENKNYTQAQLEEVIGKVLSLSFTYLDRAVKEMLEFQLKDEKDITDQMKAQMGATHAYTAILLDITHRAFPLAYDLFKDHKLNLDNIFDMYKRFESAKFLNVCPCDYCKSRSVNNENTKSENS